MIKLLKDFLPNIFANDTWKYNLLRNWKSIVGPLSTKVRIEKILNDTVVLGVTNSCWLQELYILSPIIVKTINQNLDKPRIKQIRFKKTGHSVHIQAKPRKTQVKKTSKEISLTTGQKRTLMQIKDPELREALKKFLERCYGERK